MNNQDIFETKRGQLTRYAFACGYIERLQMVGNGHDFRVEIWMEHRSMNVRVHDADSQAIVSPFSGPGRVYWEGFDSVTQAYRAYQAKVRECKQLTATSN